MRSKLMIAATCVFMAGLIAYAFARRSGAAVSQSPAETIADPAKILVDRLDLERYKATIKGLTQFGDRRQGTDRKRHDQNGGDWPFYDCNDRTTICRLIGSRSGLLRFRDARLASAGCFAQ